MPSPRGCSRRGSAWPPSQRSLHGQQALEQREQPPARPPSAGCHRNRRKTQNQRLSQRKVPSSKPGLAGDLLRKLPEATSEERRALKGPPTGDRSDLPDVLRQPQGGLLAQLKAELARPKNSSSRSLDPPCVPLWAGPHSVPMLQRRPATAEAWSHHTGPGAERAHHRRPQGSSPTFQQRPQSTALPSDIVVQSFN